MIVGRGEGEGEGRGQCTSSNDVALERVRRHGRRRRRWRWQLRVPPPAAICPIRIVRDIVVVFDDIAIAMRGGLRFRRVRLRRPALRVVVESRRRFAVRQRRHHRGGVRPRRRSFSPRAVPERRRR